MSDSLSLISSSRFHRRVTLETENGPLTVSFADIGCITGPAVMFLPGMFASRYVGIPLHPIAEHAGVRLLVVDRPGMGASTDVPLNRRLATWIDLFPRLLAYLGITRISLIAHSAGTVYLLNTWAQCRELLNPDFTLLAPWVDPDYSRVTVMQMAQYIPAKAFTLWHRIPRFFVTQAGPVVASSGALLRQMSPKSGVATEENSSFLEDYGISRTEQAELFRLAIPFMWEENTVGANSEALQCLRKSDGCDWGACSDYAQCAQVLAAREQSMDGQASLRVYFAATDALVGSRGQRYFEQCWQAPGVEAIDFIYTTVDKSDHDTVMQSGEVWGAIFAAMSGRQ